MNAIVELQVATGARHPELAQFEAWVSVVNQTQQNNLPILIRLVGHHESQSLNKQFRDKDKATNVLSFVDDPIPGFEQTELGELVICAPLVRNEARQLAIPVLDHWAHLTVHGCLHLLGFDHVEDQQAQQMEALEIKLLKQLNIASPY